MIGDLKHDFYQSKGKKPTLMSMMLLTITDAGYRAVVLYRLGAYFRKRKIRFVAVICEKLMHHLCHCWISTNASIGPGLVIRHVGTIVIGSKVEVGKNLDIRQGITLGGNMGKKSVDGRSQPKLGDNVLLGAGAMVLGPVIIGDNCVIGANSVIIKSFEDNSIIGGVPGILIRKKNPDLNQD